MGRRTLAGDLFIVCAAAFLFGAPGLHGAIPADRRIGPEWLQQNMTRADIRIVDMRGDVREYWEGHLPGAVFLDSAALRWADRGVPLKLMPVSALALLLGEMGIGRETTVVVYSEINHYRATYFLWALDVIGHKKWAVLEGGCEGWKQAGRPLTQDYPALRPAVYPAPKAADSSVRASLAEVRDRNAKTTVLLDTRPADMYSGAKGSWKRKGHIPGALNHYWADDVLEAGLWKPVEDLKRAFEALGATPDKTIIVSCGQGLMASHTYVALKHVLGYPQVKLYDGSFNEWSAVESLPVETGTKQK
jgi:thiosulfate/3-mercaptopyruvate sulfurtransferase